MKNNKYNVSICLLCKDENEYINEWLKYHIDIGIDHFYIYDNMSEIPLKNSIEKELLDKCSIREWNLNVREDGNIQIKCYNDCLFNCNNESKWIAFIDTDEFINIKDGLNINDFMARYDDYDGLYIDWVIYNANGQIKKENKPIRERFTTIVPYHNRILKRGKCIVKASRVHAMGPHFPLMPLNELEIVNSDYDRVYDARNRRETPVDKISIDHYLTRSYEEWCEKIERGSCVPDFERKMDEFFFFNPDLMWLKDDIEEGESKE